MIVIAGPETDITADALCEDFRAFGLSTERVSSLSQLSVVLRQHARTTSVAVRLASSGGPVAGLLNRGMWHLGADTLGATERFIAHESDAAWWAACALWPNPVINRSDGGGLLGSPALEAMAELLDWSTAAQVLCDDFSVLNTDQASSSWNVHRLPDRLFVARLGRENGATRVDRPGPAVLTRFEPQVTGTLVLAGRRAFVINRSPGVTDGWLDRACADLQSLADRHGPRFFVCTVQLDEQRPSLTALSLLPALFQYSAMRSEIHRALADVFR